MTTMDVVATAVVIVNWNGWKDTIQCIEALLKLRTTGPLAIIVCDNASTDGSIEQLRRWAVQKYSNAPERFVDLAATPTAHLPSPRDQFILVQTGRNGGYAAGNNVGLDLALAAGYAYLWVLNNDTEVEVDALEALLARMKEDVTIGICGSTLIYADQRDRVQAWGGARFIPLKGRGVPLGTSAHVTERADRDAVEKDMGYVIGASMFVRREFIEIVGLMTEDYFLYWEEIDWATRGAGRFRLGYAPNSRVYHKVGASIGTRDTGDSSPLADYYLARGRLKFCMRFSRISLPFVIFETLRSIARCLAQARWYRAANLARAFLGIRFVGEGRA